MIVGVPTETKTSEDRVAITPHGVRELTRSGHQVIVQAGAGAGSALTDASYTAAGAMIVDSPADLFAEADLICKVKEPRGPELEMLRPGQVLFTYLHLAAYPEVARGLLESGATAIGYETVTGRDGSLPLLAPMSEVAGRLAVQAGAHHLERPHGGRGILLGGVTGVRPAKVVVIGVGTAGMHAATCAAGMGAEVVALDVDTAKLRHIDDTMHGRVVALMSNHGTVHDEVAGADLVIGAVLVRGRRAPHLVSEEMVADMRSGSVVVDIAVDQGGCIETTRETTHAAPTFVVHDVVHYGVANIPAAVPHTSTFALTNTTMPYLRSICDLGLAGALDAHPGLADGVQIADGAVCNTDVAASLDLPCESFVAMVGAPAEPTGR